MRTTTNYLHSQAKESQAKWAAIRNAANLLEAIVAEMVQAVAEADEVKLLRHKRRELENCYNSQFIPESLTQLRTVQFYGAIVADSYNELSQWFKELQGATTFAQWQECRSHIIRLRTVFYNRYYQISDYATDYVNHFGELLVHYRRELAKENKKLFAPVAVPKAVRKDAIRNAIMQHTLVPQTVATCSNSNLYKLAKYHLGRNAARKLQYGFRLTFGIWSRAIVLCRMFPRV